MRALIATALGTITSGLHSFSTVNCAATKSPFSQSEFRQFTLIDSYNESHNTKVFRFALPEADMPLNLDVSSVLTVRYTDENGKDVLRPYTPINNSDQRGYFEILVKRYENSKMGSHFFSLKKGDVVDFKGPWVKIPIRSNQYKHIGMLAGGTGIAPMYQVARNILRDPKNTTKISLIYANKRKEDVLLGNELNDLMQKHPLFYPYFVLSRAPSDWMGGVGHITSEMIKSIMPPPNHKDSIILVCGPPHFMESISGDKDFSTRPPAQGQLKGILKDIGYGQNMVFKF
ncbi:Oxidoreductase FAD binding domain [Trypanosoma vivax]|uniref:NADH-cytochrome b5 reductase n=1 Tax=Trypanosoma vivax (strain Y486) TaxID=1055687 RepID=G0TY81_TRYVY|nr:Oxidoreductase FAD binding domain [Trypanosoma vivax]CCC48926.1 putative NADH-cytochrome b5 reductase [Trypanosoma vivax Y486]